MLHLLFEPSFSHIIKESTNLIALVSTAALTVVNLHKKKNKIKNTTCSIVMLKHTHMN